MKTISKVLALSLCLMASINTASAQPQRMTPEERAKIQTEALTKQLSLTKDQVAKVDSINLQYAKLNQEAFSKAGSDREAMRKSMTENQEKHKGAMKSVLTDEQFKKYEEWLKEQQQRMLNNRGGRR